MKFTVDVENFWIEEADLSKELQSQVQRHIVAEIRESVKTQVNNFMDQHIRAVINAELQSRVQILMDEIIATGKIKGDYSSDPQITVKEYIVKNFANRKPDITAAIAKQVTQHFEELKNRYDLLFATQLITKIKEQGMLKDEAVKMLLSTPE